MEINFTSKSNEDISFIELHRYITYLVSSKKMTLDDETNTYIKNLQNNYLGLEEFERMTEKELLDKKNQIVEKFNKQMNDTKDKFKKLKLIKEILEIDLNYYYKQLKNIKSILKNDNFKISINIINDKISSNQVLNDIEKQKITFYNKLINQKIYIQNIILSDTIIFKTKKDIIKKELFNEMKSIENETEIFIENFNKEELKNKDFDYKKIMKIYNDNQLQKLLSSLDEMIFEDKSESLRYKIIDNLHKLTNKSYKEINMILKDNKFKEKLFGNLKIGSINEKLKILSTRINEYNEIKNYLDEYKKIEHVCPLCNFKHDMEITVMLHLSLHKNKKYINSIKFRFYRLNDKTYSSYSAKEITNLTNYLYDIKMILLNDKNMTKSILFEEVNKGSFEEMRQPISLNKIIHKVDNIKIINEFKETMLKNKEKFGKMFNISEKVKNIINEQILKMEKSDNTRFNKYTRIINFKIFKNIFDNFIIDEDINNLYNSSIEYYDNNLKSQKNISFDLLFKNIIHYNNKKPIEGIYDLMKKLFKIIKYIKEKKQDDLLSQKDETGYSIDTKVLIMLVPLLKSLDLLKNISNVVKDNEDIKIDDNFDLSSWTDKKNYKKLINMISNVRGQDKTDEIMEQFVRLNELFENINMKKLKRMEKQFDLIYEIYIYMIKNNMFLHNISKIESNKNIKDKYNEYLNGSFLIITMNYMNMLMKENKNNIENTKEVYDIFFKSLSLYLTEDSKYLNTNKVVFTKRLVRQERVIHDNRDELLNEYFESDEEDFNEEIINESEKIFEDEKSDLDEDLFGDEDEDLF